MAKDLAKNQSELIKFVLSYCLHFSYVYNEIGYCSATTCQIKGDAHIPFFKTIMVKFLFCLPTKEHQSYFYHSCTCPQLAYIIIRCNFYTNEELHDIFLISKKSHNVTLVTELFTFIYQQCFMLYCRCAKFHFIFTSIKLSYIVFYFAYSPNQHLNKMMSQILSILNYFCLIFCQLSP